MGKSCVRSDSVLWELMVVVPALDKSEASCFIIDFKCQHTQNIVYESSSLNPIFVFTTADDLHRPNKMGNKVRVIFCIQSTRVECDCEPIANTEEYCIYCPVWANESDWRWLFAYAFDLVGHGLILEARANIERHLLSLALACSMNHFDVMWPTKSIQWVACCIWCCNRSQYILGSISHRTQPPRVYMRHIETCVEQFCHAHSPWHARICIWASNAEYRIYTDTGWHLISWQLRGSCSLFFLRFFRVLLSNRYCFTRSHTHTHTKPQLHLCRHTSGTRSDDFRSSLLLCVPVCSVQSADVFLFHFTVMRYIEYIEFRSRQNNWINSQYYTEINTSCLCE